ncbi:hypothetical protein FRC01_002411, partial [Tulasnella sp. 417]
MLSIGKQAQDDPYAQWDALLPREPSLTPAAEEPDFECRICQEPPTDPCVTRCGHLYCLNCLRQWLDFSPKCPTCKTLSSIHDVVPIYRGDSALSSGPSSPEAATSTSSRSSVSLSQRLLSPPPNHLLRPLPDDSQVAPSAFFPWSWSSTGKDEQPPTITQRSASSKSRAWRRSAFTTSTSSPASSVLPELASPNLAATSSRSNTLLAPPPPRFRFTLKGDPTELPPHLAAAAAPPPGPGHPNAEEQEDWDTDDEMEFQLNQIASIKVPQTITDAVNGVAAAGEVYQGQPYTVTMFVIDVSPSMAKTREIQLTSGPDGEEKTKEITNLEWALEFVLLKVQEMIFAGRKTDQCGVILFGTKKTKNCINEANGGYDHVTEYIPIAQPTQHTLDLISAIKPSKVQGDALDGLIVAIQTQATYLGKKKSWTRKITVLTDGESPLNTEDWEGTAEKLNELEVYTTIIGVDFDDEEFKEEDKSEQKTENEEFLQQFGSQIEKCLIGSCYQALEDCALPDIKSVKPAAKHIILRLG